MLGSAHGVVVVIVRDYCLYADIIYVIWFAFAISGELEVGRFPEAQDTVVGADHEMLAVDPRQTPAGVPIGHVGRHRARAVLGIIRFSQPVHGRYHLDGHRGGVASVGDSVASVGDGVGEGVDAGKAGVGRVGDRGVVGACDADSAVNRRLHFTHAQRIVLRVAVVLQHRNFNGSDFVSRGLIIQRNRCVVHRIHRHHDRTDGGQFPIRDDVGEGVGAVEVVVLGGVGEAGSAVYDLNGAVGRVDLGCCVHPIRCTHPDHTEVWIGVRVHVPVVVQHVNIDGHALVGRDVIGHRHRRVVLRIHRHHDRTDGGQGRVLAVRDDVGEGVFAEEVAIGGVGDGGC